MRKTTTHRLWTAAAVLTLVLATGCGASEPPASSTGTDSRATSAEVPTEKYRPVVRNAYGTTTTAAYDSIAQARLGDRPYDGAKGLKFSDEYSFLGLADVAALAQRSRIVVRGTVLAIGRPHFNSSAGGFWHPELVDEPGITDAASEIFRDVTVVVTEVWASTDSSVRIGTPLTFRVRGGQIQVQLDAQTVRKLELPSKPSYIFSSEPAVELTTGENAVFFLTYDAVDGLYRDGDRDRYGTIGRLLPAHDAAYKFTIEGEQARNTYRTAPNDNFNVDVASLRQTVNTELARGCTHASDDVRAGEPASRRSRRRTARGDERPPARPRHRLIYRRARGPARSPWATRRLSTFMRHDLGGFTESSPPCSRRAC